MRAKPMASRKLCPRLKGAFPARRFEIRPCRQVITPYGALGLKGAFPARRFEMRAILAVHARLFRLKGAFPARRFEMSLIASFHPLMGV